MTVNETVTFRNGTICRSERVVAKSIRRARALVLQRTWFNTRCTTYSTYTLYWNLAYCALLYLVCFCTVHTPILPKIRKRAPFWTGVMYYFEVCYCSTSRARSVHPPHAFFPPPPLDIYSLASRFDSPRTPLP